MFFQISGKTIKITYVIYYNINNDAARSAAKKHFFSKFVEKLRKWHVFSKFLAKLRKRHVFSNCWKNYESDIFWISFFCDFQKTKNNNWLLVLFLDDTNESLIMSGTSMAAPLVAGIALTIMSRHSITSPDTIKKMMKMGDYGVSFRINYLDIENRNRAVMSNTDASNFYYVRLMVVVRIEL